MANWNPSATGTLGMQWLPIYGGAINLDATNKMIATSFDQTVSQTIGTIQTPNTGIGVRGGLYAIEVYDNETAVGDVAAVELQAVPNEDVSAGGWLNSAGNTTNMYSYIDEGSTYNIADYVRRQGATSVYQHRYNTATLSLTGKRIVAVRMNAFVQLGPNTVFAAYFNIGGALHLALPEVYGTRTYFWHSSVHYYNPATKKPWTIADIQAFDSTDEVELWANTSAGWTAVDVYTTVLSVLTVAENRIAVGVLDDTASALTVGTNTVPAWNTATMLTPTGGAWTKDGAGRHLYTARRINNTGSLSYPFFDTDPNTGLVCPIGQSWDPKVDPTYGFAIAMEGGGFAGVTGDVSAVGEQSLTRMYPVIQRTTAPADSVDSQPYTVSAVAGVYTGRNAESEFSGAAAVAYGILRFYVSTYYNPTANLDVKIKRRSDNVQLGGTYSLTAAVANSFPSVGSSQWRLVQVQLPSSATLAAATQYYVEFSSTALSAAAWVVDAIGTSGNGNAATYNGTTDAATINGAAENLGVDMLVTLATIPTAPASMTVALGSQTVGETVACVTAIPRADLSWSATALGGSFLRYEIQRSEDAGATWAEIARVTVESVVAWKDYEARRGVAATYRIRVVRSDAAFSAWRDGSASVTKPLLSTTGTTVFGSTMYLTTNYNPTQNLAYEYRPVKEYAFNEATEQQLQGAYGRDYQLGANPVENRGITARWTFLVGLDDKLPSGGGVGWNAYTPLRNLARAAVPYICVLDHRGNRMYAQLSVPSGTEDSSGGADRYLAEVSGSELASTPYVVTVTA